MNQPLAYVHPGAKIAQNVVIEPFTTINNDVVIGEGAIVLAQSGIAKSLEGGKTYFGSPCGEVRVKWREIAALRKLPEIMDNL